MTTEQHKTSRPLRVLHIGNIANNAYRLVKLLNEAGLDCDVMCYDYYHLMGTPEWEDAEITGIIANQFYPDWHRVDLHGFVRPRWFAQASFRLCAHYLLAKRHQQSCRMWFWWHTMAIYRWAMSYLYTDVSARTRKWLRFGLATLYRLRYFTKTIPGSILYITSRIIRRMKRSSKPPSQAAQTGYARRSEELVRAFQQQFPERKDQLTIMELGGWRSLYNLAQELFAEYDIVQGYATDPFLPLMAAKRPYVAFEHGTLRDIPFQPTLQGRITALGYSMADGVFITNGDCLASVEPLKIRYYMPTIHPIDERDCVEVNTASVPDYRAMFGVKYLFLCTLRHDWAIKGTDVYLRALPALAKRLGETFKLFLVTWGQQVEDSRCLLEQLKVSHLVHWMEPIHRRAMLRLQNTVDVLFDQVALPHFGATAPEAIAAGLPVLSSYKPESTAWIVSEPAPILSVFNPEDVVKQTLVALDPAWCRDYILRAQAWIKANHSRRRVIEDHLKMYNAVLEGSWARAER